MSSRVQASPQWGNIFAGTDTAAIHNALDDLILYLYKDEDEKNLRGRSNQLFEYRLYYPLVALIAKPPCDPTIEAKVAKALRRASWPRETKKSINSAGAVPVLVRILNAGNPDAKADAAAALSNLV
jgi:hypothetical protein